MSVLGWAILVLTQPVVWVLLTVAALVQLPFTLLCSCCRERDDVGGQHVLITGGSEGVGLELALECVRRGARVTLVARTLSKLEAARAQVLCTREAQTLLHNGVLPDSRVCIASADVGSREQLAAAVQRAEAALGPVDVCIAAAGAAIPKYFDELTADDFSHMLAVNYMGVVHLAQLLLPGMASRGRGHFAAISSMAAAVPFVGYAAYSPAKAACRALVDTLRNEYADVPGVRFHLAFPPDVDTPGFARENETKPWETSHVWPAVFNETFSARDVARLMLDGMARGDYHLRSPDAFGNLLVSRAWGHHPRAAPLLEAAIAPLFVAAHGGMCWMADRVVRKGARHKGLAYVHGGGGGV